MNILSWIGPNGIKNKILNYLDEGNIKELKKFLEENNLMTEQKVNTLFYDRYKKQASTIINMFDEDGKVICEHEDYLYFPPLMILFAKSDPTIKEEYSDIEKQLIDYYIQETKEGRTDDLLYISVYISDYINLTYNNKLENIFNGKEITKEFYDYLFKRNLTSYKEKFNKTSNKLKNNFSKEELDLIDKMNKVFKLTHYKNKELIEQLVDSLKREDIPKYIKITGHGKKMHSEIILNEEILDLIIFAPALKQQIINKYSSEEELRKYLSKYYDETIINYFLLGDETLDELFKRENYTIDNLENTIYLYNNKIFLKPEYIIKLVEERRFYELLQIIEKYFNKDDIDKIKLEDNIRIEALLKISIIYNKFESEGNYSLSAFIIDNLEKNINLMQLDDEKLSNFENVLTEIHNRILKSNSPELKNFGNEIIYQILENGIDFDYKSALDKIEEIFLSNNLPVVAKKFLIYQILNQNFAEVDLNNNMIISPTLKSIDKNKRFELIFSDLMRITLGSNNISMKKYLENIYYGNALYSKIINNSISIDNFPPKEQEILHEFLMHLCALYNHTKEGEKKPYNLSGNMLEDLNKLIPLFKPTNKYSLPDRIIRMYCYPAGFKSFQEVYDYMSKVVSEADKRGRELAKEHFSLEKGDLVKGINSIDYLYDILQNGSLCKEFLGPNMTSDATPLDTDLSMITQKLLFRLGNMEQTKSNSYGPIWFVIKKGKFPITRKEAYGKTEFTTTGPECFTTLEEGHMGIRTGFATSDIDYIMIDQRANVSIDEIVFIIALNGIYIPVIDKNTGSLIFTPDQYDNIREKMDGLSYYGKDEFTLSNNLDVPIDYDNQALIEDARNKKEKINEIISDIVKSEFGYEFKTKLSADISPGSVELIDTGSTGRGTNVDMSSDFDFIMRIDERVDRKQISQAICSRLGINYEEATKKGMIISNGNLRLKAINIQGIDNPIDIDITFLSKADQISYTTDMAISDRLEVIKKTYPDKYEDVLDNIIYAKQFLKENKVYKPTHSRDKNQGGLGGVGIENWILQNKGSFHDACQSFYDAATEHGIMISYEKFKKKYKIYDFGVNFYNGNHDEFVEDNMSPEGYKKMYKAVQEYLKTHKKLYSYNNKNHNNTNILTENTELEDNNKHKR